MDIFGIGIPELLVILVLTMVAVGPEKMVEYAGKAGTWFARFSRETSAVTKEFKEALDGAVEDAELEDAPRKNQTPTEWRFKPTQFAVPNRVADEGSGSVVSERPQAVRDTSDEDAMALLQSLDDRTEGPASPAVLSVASSQPEIEDEVLAAAAAEAGRASRVVTSRAETTAAQPAPAASLPVPRPAPAPAVGDISDLLGSAFGIEDEPAPQAAPVSVPLEPQAPAAPPSEPEPQPEDKPAAPPRSAEHEPEDPLDALGDALSFSFDDDQGGR